MDRMHIAHFDCHCTLGRHLDMAEGQPETPEQLLAAMDHFGIHEALVLDSLSVSTNPIEGNRRVVRRTRPHPRLHPAWSALMTHSRETPPPDEMLHEMREGGVGALYLFYGQFQIPLERWAVGGLLDLLARERVPLFLCPTITFEADRIDATDWSGVVRLCRDYPTLPVVVTETRIYLSQRAMYEALEACPNLKVDLASLWLHKRIEYVCREWGADRLLWSSRLPVRTPGASKMQLDFADISGAELAAIAGGNLRRMLSWNPNIRFETEVEFPEPVDPLHRAARERTSLRSERFHDCHGHIGWCSRRHVIQDRPEDVVAEMDRLGIRSCCVFSFVGTDEVYGNDTASEMVRRYPDRFVGFTVANPRHGKRLMLEELERGLDLGMRGVKLAPSFQHYPLDGPLIDVACEFAHRHRQFMLNHYWGPTAHLRRLCTTYPNACFFTGHSTMEHVDLVRDVDNLYICTCPFLGWEETERYVAAYGADRILFGSDLMDLPITWGLGQILYARIPEADKRKILGENLLGLMQRYSSGSAIAAAQARA